MLMRQNNNRDDILSDLSIRLDTSRFRLRKLQQERAQADEKIGKVLTDCLEIRREIQTQEGGNKWLDI